MSSDLPTAQEHGAPPPPDPELQIALVADASSVNVQQWVEGLLSAGSNIDLISFAPWPNAPCPVHRLTVPIGLGKAKYLLAGWSVRRITTRINPDLVVGYYGTGYGTVARLARRRPLVQVVVGNDVLVNPKGTLTHAAARRNYQVADLVVAWSRQLGEGLEMFRVTPGRTLVLPRGISTAMFTPSVGVRSDATRLITTRALHPYYRTELIVAAAAACGGLQLTVVGDGPDRENLRRLAEAERTRLHTQFTGWLPNDELGSVLREHDIYVSMSPTDGSSASLLEAMCVGLLPIVIDNDANREWIENGRNGLLVSADNGGDALASAIKRAVHDVPLRRRASEANQAIVRVRADVAVNSRRFLHEFRRLIVDTPSEDGPATRRRLRKCAE